MCEGTAIAGDGGSAALQHPESCIQCGTCVSVCPVEMVGGHAIVTFLTDPEASDYSVWLCSSCWRCSEACPSGVNIHELMMSERRRLPAPVWYRASYDRIEATGFALDIFQDDVGAVRADRGLEDVLFPPPGRASRLLRADQDPEPRE